MHEARWASAPTATAAAPGRQRSRASWRVAAATLAALLAAVALLLLARHQGGVAALIALAGLALGSALWLQWRRVRQLRAQLERLSQALARVADGDLDVQLPPQNELARRFNDMVL